MRRPVLWFLGVVAAVAVLAIGAAVALPFLVRTPRVQSLIASQASHALGRPVTFSSVSVSVFPLPAVVLNGLQVAEDVRFGTTPFLTLERGELRLRFRPLLGGRVEFGDLILRKPVIAVTQDAQGRWNFATLGRSGAEPRVPSSRPRSGGSAPPPPPLASDVKLQDGVVTVTARPAGRPAQTYRIDDVDVAIHGAAGGVTFTGTARLQPGDVAMKIADGRLMPTGKPLGDAGLAGKVTIESKEVKDLAVLALGPEPAIAGAMTGALTLGGTVGNPRGAGEMALADVTVTQTHRRCAEPNRRTLKLRAVTLTLGWYAGQFSAVPVQMRIADGSISSHVVVTDHGTHVQARELMIRSLPLQTVLVDFLCQGYAVTGPLDLTGALSFERRDIWNTLAGSGQFKVGAGRIVGTQALALLGDAMRPGGVMSSLLAAEMPTSPLSSPLEFDGITGTYQITKGVVSTRDLVYTSRAMRMGVVGEYALGSGRMNLDLVITHTRGELQAKVTGSAAAPSIRLLPTSTLRSVDPGRAQSGLEELLRRIK